MTNAEKDRLKAELIEEELIEHLEKANGKYQLWVNDPGAGPLNFSTTTLGDKPTLIVQGQAVPQRTTKNGIISNAVEDKVIDFLKDMVGIETAEARALMRDAQRAYGHPSVRVKLVKINGVLTVSGRDEFNEVGTDGLFIHGCRIQGSMEINANVGGQAELVIRLQNDRDLEKFKLNLWYNLVYKEPTGSALGIASVSPH